MGKKYDTSSPKRQAVGSTPAGITNLARKSLVSDMDLT